MAKTDKMTSYGLYLQTVRVEKGITIERVALETRIRSDILHAIEAEDHKHLPDDVFVKGFLRAFARAIGADEEETLRRFALRRQVQTPDQTPLKPDSPGTGRFWLTLMCVTALMVGLVGGTLLIYQMLSRPGIETVSHPPTSETQETVSPETPPATKTVETEKASPNAAAEAAKSEEDAKSEETGAGEALKSEEAVKSDEAAGPEEAAVQGEAAGQKDARYQLEIVCDEETWLKVLADDAPAAEYILKPGETLRLRADRNFNLLIGNAGGVSIQMNGDPVPLSGKSGQVVNLQLP